MTELTFPYGKEKITHMFGEELVGVLTSSIEEYEPDLTKLLDNFLSRGRNETLPDQWMSQIIVRILTKARVVYVSEMPDGEVRAMHMIPAHSLPEALEIARGLVGREDATITAVPDGIAVMVTE